MIELLWVIHLIQVEEEIYDKNFEAVIDEILAKNQELYTRLAKG